MYASPDPTSLTPPPYWPAIRPLLTSMPALAKFYAGGWKQERWWEEAFKACEDERRERLGPFVGTQVGRREGLSGGLEGVRGLGN